MSNPHFPLAEVQRGELPRPGRRSLGWALLPVWDAMAVALAGLLSLSLLAGGGLLGTRGPWSGSGWASSLLPLVAMAAVLAPFLLDDRGAGQRASCHRPLRSLWRFGYGFLGLLALMAVLLHAGHWWAEAPMVWLLSWAVVSLTLTGAARYRLILAAPSISAAPRPRAAGTQWVAEAVPVRLLADRPIRRWSAVFKSAKDLVLASVLLVGLSPVLGVIALAIRLDSPGPLLFRQRRHGLHNAEFDILKFRTMSVAAATASGALEQTRRGDARVTRVGGFLRRWSLDELPQLFNVLNGSMSLVGPRPHAIDMRTEARLGEEITPHYPHRHRVRPGMTGWSQVNGARGATESVEQLHRRVTLDLHYIDHWSLLLDLKILILTTRAVLKKTNAF